MAKKKVKSGGATEPKKKTPKRVSGQTKKSSKKKRKKKASTRETLDHDRYEELRSALIEQQREWERAARLFPNLFHQLIFSPMEPLSDEAWSAFMVENSSNSFQNNWEEWHEHHDWSCGRFFGNRMWFETFKSMAEATNHILIESFHDTLGPHISLPETISFVIPDSSDHLGWLDLVYDTALAATPMLHWISRFWNIPEEWPFEEKEQLSMESWGTTGLGVKFPMHPTYIKLPHNIFRSSSETIRYWLNPDRIPIIGQCMGESPIRLPKLSKSSKRTPTSSISPLWKRSARQNVPKMKPRFDRTSRKLFLDDMPIKTFTQPTPDQPPRHQELIIIGFEEIGWETRQDNPIRRVDGENVARFPQQQMARAVRDFNRLEDEKFLRQQKSNEQATHIFRLDYEVDCVKWFLMDID